MKIRKAVIPAAGRGTRFLPYTSVIPKEMLLLGTKPAIELVIEEALASGITHIIIVLHPDKKIIKEYLDSRSYDCTITYVYQSAPRGLGDAIACAQDSIEDDEFFAVMLPDDFVVGKTAALLQLINLAYQEQVSVLAISSVAQEKIPSYGIVAPAQHISDRAFYISSLIEKPRPEHAPSSYAIVGRYVLPNDIFTLLRDMGKKAIKHELGLTPALQQLINDGQKIIGMLTDGERYDIGTPAGWLQAVIALGILNS